MPAIQAPLAIPPVHPKDKNLLRPLSELGKPAFDAGGYSFLRRTEYISSDVAKARAEANAHAARTTARLSTAAKTRKPTDAQKEDPMYILRSVIKGFDLANPEDAYTGPDNASNIRGAAPTPAEVEAWENPKHPSKPDVKLVDAYALQPDLEATTDSGGYFVVKFAGNPSGMTDKRDIRMDVGVLYPRDQGSGTYDYDFFLPTDEDAANSFRDRFDVDNPNRHDPNLYTHKGPDGSDNFRYNYLRTYDASRTVTSVNQQYKEVALALHDHIDNDTDKQDSGAYYYPIIQRTQLKPRRNKNLARLGLASQTLPEDMEKVDWINLTVEEPDEDELGSRAKHRNTLEAEFEGHSDKENL